MGLVFGSSKAQVLEWSDTIAEATGKSTFEISAMATEFQSVLGPMMGAKDAAVEFSQGLTQMAIDVSSAKNMDEKMALNKLRAGIIGEVEPLRSLGVVMSQTNLQAHALGQGNQKLLKDMTQAELVALRYSFITQGLADIQGDAANTSDQYANRVRALSSKFNDIMVVVGQALVPVFNLFLGKMIDLGNFMMANKAAIQDWIRKGWMVLFGVLDSVLAIVQFNTKQWDVLKIVGVMAVNSILEILRVLVETLEFVLTPFSLLADALEALGGAANPIKGIFETAFSGIDSAIESTAVTANHLVDSFGDSADKVAVLREGVQKLGHDADQALGQINTLEQPIPEEPPKPKVEDPESAKEADKRKKEADEKSKEEKRLWEEKRDAAANYGTTVGEVFMSMAEGQESFARTMKKTLGSSLDALRDNIISSIQMKAADAGAGAGSAVAGVPVIGPMLMAGAIAAAFALVKGLISKMHTGGMVDRSNLTQIPGLKSDEGLAILQTGEQVIPRGGGGGESIQVQYNSVFPQTRADVDSFVDSMLVPALQRRKSAGAY